ncbi:double-strand break repair protein AddB [Litoreibacter ponti]|uniref:Double-strand break repair protein AddB n=1 Tax=Litoreibacter ponti TaxID=1510457 RepID=A0A2T6BPY0_9RHOB|nr:double-strand break repair protein AddB [Litoreibacter ponti]PTX58102.1 double-strand break repair protein AddB [Litoreibacter ponti]
MFEPQAHARVFHVPCGVDFPKAVVDGLRTRIKDLPPETATHVEIYVNTTRMQRRIRALLCDGGAQILPRIHLITEIAHTPLSPRPDPTSALGRRLELAQLVRKLIDSERAFDTPARAFDLADSLASLLEEMEDEGVAPSDIAKLDVGEHAQYWQRSQAFLNLVAQFIGTGDGGQKTQRGAALELISRWQAAPPEHSILIVGSTGSRGTTRLVMEAAARLPQGALILPGFDDQMPAHVWRQLDDPLTGEGHPQFRFRTLLQNLDLDPTRLKSWDTQAPVSTERNALISLALRPAPVTDEWLSEGPKLQGLDEATAPLTLLEAPTARDEAVAIAMRLRRAAEDGVTAALITPDRTLTRQVTSALARWGIEPDDSAGVPLLQTPVGRLLRQTAQLMGQTLASDKLLALLKHPLVCASQRNSHLKNTRDFELEVLRKGAPFPTRADLDLWIAKRDCTPELQGWADWLWPLLEQLEAAQQGELDAHLDLHLTCTEHLAQGPGAEQSALWKKEPGEKAAEALAELRTVADKAGVLSPSAYSDLITFTLGRHEVRDANAPHPGIMIWGTLEARVQGAELVILAGLNDGIWPDLPDPDPWLNRQMRKDAGLLLPERRVGLSAHDFQQAISAPEVWLTRAKRDAEAETVQARWMNRLTNLLGGLEDGRDALAAMQARGDEWIEMAARLDTPAEATPPAPRPSPQPPVEARPKKLPVTQIEKLIRDPYAIYAKYVLRLRPLDPLHATADAPLRGRALHEAMDRFTQASPMSLPDDAEDQLLTIARTVLAQMVPWPAARMLWDAKFTRAAQWFIASEAERRQLARPRFTEETGHTRIEPLDFTLEGRADRIDITPDGHAVIYDYKTGALPTPKQRKHFDKQLALLATIAERGGFAALTDAQVLRAGYIGLGAHAKEDSEDFGHGDLGAVWESFVELITAYADPDKGYSSRRAVYETRWSQDYDHLARFGEWDETDDVHPVTVGQT